MRDAIFCAEQLAIICGKVFSFIFHFVCIKFQLIFLTWYM